MRQTKEERGLGRECELEGHAEACLPALFARKHGDVRVRRSGSQKQFMSEWIDCKRATRRHRHGDEKRRNRKADGHARAVRVRLRSFVVHILVECERCDGSDSLSEEANVVLDGVEGGAAVVEDLDEWLGAAAGADGRVIVHRER